MNPAIAASIVLLSAAALALSLLVLQRFRTAGSLPHFWWGLGIFLVFVTLAEEAALYAGVWSQLLIRSYFVLVAVLVGLLSLGSAQLSLQGRWRAVWYAFVAVSGVSVAVVGALTFVPPSVLYHGVVWSSPPLALVIASSIVTFPSALLLIVSSAYGAVRQHRPRLLFITVGTSVIALSGSLYIVSFPVALYYAEFVGVVLLFLGFLQILTPTPRTTTAVPA